MALALTEAARARAHGDVPVGAVALVDGRIVASRHNERERTGDPTAHAELLALRDAAAALGGWRLGRVTLVVTLEPCPMCAGALVASRVGRLVFGAADPKAGACGSLYNLCADPRLNHEVDVRGGVRRRSSARRSSVPSSPTAASSPEAHKRPGANRYPLIPEGCESGRIGRSRKPLCPLGTVGSNPTPSAIVRLIRLILRLAGTAIFLAVAPRHRRCGAIGPSKVHALLLDPWRLPRGMVLEPHDPRA